MKSTYCLALLAGIVMSSTAVSAAAYDIVNLSDDERGQFDRIKVIADDFEDRHDRAQEEKDKKRSKKAVLAAERKAAIARLEAENNRKEKMAKALESEAKVFSVVK